jgi:hypothetical protein
MTDTLETEMAIRAEGQAVARTNRGQRFDARRCNAKARGEISDSGTQNRLPRRSSSTWRSGSR